MPEGKVISLDVNHLRILDLGMQLTLTAIAELQLLKMDEDQVRTIVERVASYCTPAQGKARYDNDYDDDSSVNYYG